MGSLHPWVTDDVSHGESLVSVELEHTGDEVLEVLSEEALWVTRCVHFPEKVSPVGGQQFVV